MSLVTVQRSPTPSVNGDDCCELPKEFSSMRRAESLSEICCCSSGSQRSLKSIPPQKKSCGECYFAVKGAAVTLPQSECVASMPRQASTNSSAGEIQLHLKAMLHLLRAQDTLKMAVRLESMLGNHTRYMAIVSTTGRQDNQESILLGIDYVSPADTSVGLVLPIWASTAITLDGDGGICVESTGCQHIFKPMSVQAMWSAFQSLHKEHDVARSSYPYFPGGLTHTWVQYYENQIASKEAFRSEWHYAYTDDTDLKAPSLDRYKEKPPEKAAAEKMIRSALKDIMQSVDLDDVTSKDIREKLEERLNMSLHDFKEFVDQEMLVILGQMDKPSQIFPYLYLGTEWNASNWDELRQNNVGHILNVTKEVDNFFPGLFCYMKIRVSDEESTELLKHWDITYKFVSEAREKNSAVLVHCKKGISRSSSTVVAYAMKAYGWPLEKALNYVKEKRNCITPNKGFMEQLRTYQGILEASQHRKSALFNQSQILPQPSEELVPWDGIDETDTKLENIEDERSYVLSEKCLTNATPRLLVASENILKSGPPQVPSDPPSDNVTSDNAFTATNRPMKANNNNSSQSTAVGIVSNLTLKFETPTKASNDAETTTNTVMEKYDRLDDLIEISSINCDKLTSIDEDSMPNLISRLPVRRQLQNVERIGCSADLTLKNVQEILMRRSSNNCIQTSSSDSSSLSSGDESDLSGNLVILKQRRNSKSSSGTDSAVADLAGSSSEALTMAQSCPSSNENRVEIMPVDPGAKSTTIRRPLSYAGNLETSASCPVVVPTGQVKLYTHQYEMGFTNGGGVKMKSVSSRRSSPALMNLNESEDDDDEDDEGFTNRRRFESETRRRTREELKMVELTRKSQSISGSAPNEPTEMSRMDLPPSGRKSARKLFDRFFPRIKENCPAPPVNSSDTVLQKLHANKPPTKWYHEVCKRAERSSRNRPKAPPKIFNESIENSGGVVSRVALKVAQPGNVKHQKEQIERLSWGGNANSSSSTKVKQITANLEIRSARSSLREDGQQRSEGANSKLVRSLVDIFEPSASSTTPLIQRRSVELTGISNGPGCNNNIRRVVSFNSSISWRAVQEHSGRLVSGRSKSLMRHPSCVVDEG